MKHPVPLLHYFLHTKHSFAVDIVALTVTQPNMASFLMQKCCHQDENNAAALISQSISSHLDIHLSSLMITK